MYGVRLEAGVVVLNDGMLARMHYTKFLFGSSTVANRDLYEDIVAHSH